MKDHLMTLTLHLASLTHRYWRLVGTAVNGRRMVAGGQYIKEFSKYNAKIQALGSRATGGSIPIVGTDRFSSGDETTFYAVSGEMDLPIKHPVNFKVSHFYSFGDAATDKRTYSVGGRLTTNLIILVY